MKRLITLAALCLAAISASATCSTPGTAWLFDAQNGIKAQAFIAIPFSCKVSPIVFAADMANDGLSSPAVFYARAGIHHRHML